MSNGSTNKIQNGYLIHILSAQSVRDNPLKITAEELFNNIRKGGEHDFDGIFMQDEPIEIMTEAQYMESGTAKYIKYKEYDNNPEDNVTTVIKIENENSVTIIKQMEHQMRLVVREGEHYSCVYDTPFGNIPIDVFGKRVRADISEDGGKIELIYTLDFDEGFSYNNFMHIELKREEC